MTPIMRPYAIRGRSGADPVLSVMTMIAESHVSMHVRPSRKEAFFDLFSCSFFDAARVGRELAELLGGPPAASHLVARGEGYKLHRTEQGEQASRSRAWVRGARG
jgi:S-adenosylmethionine/arginine decarboxylase-like enzyme